MALNLEFDKIVEAANKRKDDLLDLQDLLGDDLNKAYHDLCSVIAWMETVRAKFLALDEEGRRMFPIPIRECLEALNPNYLKNVMSITRSAGSRGYDQRGLDQLYMEVNAE